MLTKIVRSCKIHKNAHHNVFAKNFCLVKNVKDTFSNSAIKDDEVHKIVDYVRAQNKISNLMQKYRELGHEIAATNPLGTSTTDVLKKNIKTLEQEMKYFNYNHSDELNKKISIISEDSGIHNSKEAWTPLELEGAMKEIYCGHQGYEFMHIPDQKIRDWVIAKVEKIPQLDTSNEEKLHLLDVILESEVLNQILESKFPQAKRYGAEGCDSVICGFDAMITKAAKMGVKNFIQGNAHRGRFNTLTAVFGVPYNVLFGEFLDVPGKDYRESMRNWQGDVKYHMQATNFREVDGNTIKCNILPNPSHLEVVNAFAIGKSRCKMDMNRDPKGDTVLPVVVHGDGAIAGQGICYEIANMEKLPGYQVGGTIHVIINNQLSFTAQIQEARSSNRSSDIAKVTDTFVIRVNADEPEYVKHAFELAVEYRQTFHRDVYIEILGYRLNGHSEGDQPMFTNPRMYHKIKNQKKSWLKYSDQLIEEGLITQQTVDEKMKAYRETILAGYEKAKNGDIDVSYQYGNSQTWNDFSHDPTDPNIKIETGVNVKDLQQLGVKLNTLPENKFTFNSIVEKTYKNRKETLESGKNLDWATCEQMAFTTLMNDGYDVRITGEDVQRGTFSQRHAILNDQKNGNKYSPLYNLAKTTDTTFSCYNSLLSEYGVMGFEYGYSIASSKCLTIWEAQFGDFSTVGQPVIDLAMISGEVKWGLRSGLCFFLPHGIDGQGPEHSSSKMERILQLADDEIDNPVFRDDNPRWHLYNMNFQFLNLTSPANLFHALRRQMLLDFRKPLFLAAPKKVLRHKLARSDLADIGEGSEFVPVIDEINQDLIQDRSKIRRVILCTGQIFCDLYEKRQKENINDVAQIRIEQIAPFPYFKLKQILSKYSQNSEICWAQEEPKNQAAYSYVEPRIQEVLKEQNWKPERGILYRGRPVNGTVCSGSMKRHNKEVQLYLNEALGKN